MVMKMKIIVLRAIEYKVRLIDYYRKGIVQRTKYGRNLLFGYRRKTVKILNLR
jgi:hypothetical protein